MAEGYQDIEHVEVFTPTLLNGFTLSSWGAFRLYRVGKLVIITASGLYRNVDTSVDTKIADLPFSVKAASGTGAVQDMVVTGEILQNPIIIVTGTTLQINNLLANKWVFFNLVTTIQ